MREPRHLDRSVERDELQQVERNAVPDVLEPAVTAPVPRHIGAGIVAHRQGRRPPHGAGVVVANVDGLARLIPDRIV